MFYGFNTENIKFFYIVILVTTIACAISSYAYFHHNSTRHSQSATAAIVSKEQLNITDHLLSVMKILKTTRSATEGDNVTHEIQQTLGKLTILSRQLAVVSERNPDSRVLSLARLAQSLRNPDKRIQTFDEFETKLKELRAEIAAASDYQENQIRELHRRGNYAQLVFLAVFLFLLGVQGVMIFYPTYLELKKNVQKVRKAKLDLNYASTHDPITGLLNRREGEKTLNWSIANAQEKGKMVGLFHIDIDDFKVINEKMGHSAGDNLLYQAAQRLNRTFRKTDTVARLGGDEFLVIIPNLDCEETLSNLAEKLLDVFEIPFQLIGTQETVATPSIGMACYPDDARNTQELMVAADMALRRAKEKGKNQYARFNNTMRSDFNKKMAICDRIDYALEHEEFEIFYHPQVHMQSGAITGIEALVRWRDPEIGLRTPGSFIETIEASGYMSKLGSYILNRAISDATFWYRNNINFGRIALNMSSVQLNDIDLVNQLLDSLMRHKLPPHYLSIEILENVVMTGQEHRFKQLIDELNDLDIHVELDDFGTGHASLYNLKQFSINRIKLDCNFIADIETNDRQASIVEGLIRIINNIGLEIIAEGVETIQQATLLRKWGCHHAQGFLYTKPLPFEAMTVYLKQADYKRSLDALRKQDPESLKIDHRPVKQISSV